MRIEGIYTPVITAFKSDYTIDWEGYARLIETQIEQGVHGLVIGGTTGESYALTTEERRQQFRFARRLIRRRVPWLAGVNDLRTEGVCALACAAREAGADGLLLGSPPYSCPTARELAEHALRVQRAARLPLVLYNYPARSGADMNREFLSRIARHPGFVAMKESSGEIDRLHMLAQEFPHLQLCCGTDDLALEFFAWGARAWICAAANFLLPECLALYHACVQKQDFVLGRKIMAVLLPVLTTLERSGQFVQCVKCGCEGIGLPGGPVRLPLRALPESRKRQFGRVLQRARQAFRALLGSPGFPAREIPTARLSYKQPGGRRAAVRQKSASGRSAHRVRTSCGVDEARS